MGRLGTRDADAVVALCDSVASEPALELAAVWTHFATADDEGDSFFERQLESFRAVVERVRADHPDVMVHAANSAATLRDRESHFDMVRCGVAIYGMDPFGADPAARGLRPALELRSYVADIKSFEPGDSAGYGRTWSAPAETRVGVMPVGYGDGFRRGLSNEAEALIAGRRHPVVGTISMDNTTDDLGPGCELEAGIAAVLIGADGDERILAEDLARALATINYEITCGISPRVPREYVGGGG
jgi:alanine racemase